MAAFENSSYHIGRFSKVIMDNITSNIPFDSEFCQHFDQRKLQTFNSAMKMAQYWNRRVSTEINEFTLYLGLLNYEGFITPDIGIILMTIQEIIDLTGIKTIFDTENYAFIGIKFHTVDQVKTVYDKFKTCGDSFVVFLGKEKTNTCQVKIKWATPDMSIEGIMNSVKEHVQSYNLHYVSYQYGNIKIPTATIEGTFVLKEGSTVENVPHIINMSGQKTSRVLVIIKGRPPQCLKCSNIGHVCKHCNYERCKFCYKTHLKEFICLAKQNLKITTFHPTPMIYENQDKDDTSDKVFLLDNLEKVDTQIQPQLLGSVMDKIGGEFSTVPSGDTLRSGDSEIKYIGEQVSSADLMEVESDTPILKRSVGDFLGSGDGHSSEEESVKLSDHDFQTVQTRSQKRRQIKLKKLEKEPT